MIAWKLELRSILRPSSISISPIFWVDSSPLSGLDDRLATRLAMRTHLLPPRNSLSFKLALLSTFLLLGTTARSEDFASSAKIVTQTERAFSSRCAEIGIRDSFLEYFSSDAIHFEPGPRLARPDLEHEAASVMPRLTWEPKIVRVASSAELAVSTGPYVLEGKTGKQSFGYFLSIWKKQSDGKWRVAADIGVPASKSSDLAEDFQAYDVSSASGPPDFLELLTFEREQFSRGVETAKTYQSVILPETVFERADLPLMAGESAYQPFLATLQTKRTQLAQAGANISGNLGFTYGTEEGAGHYLRVWIWSQQRWRLLFDVLANME
jgi:ketosteroid isomerase-like protein